MNMKSSKITANFQEQIPSSTSAIENENGKILLSTLHHFYFNSTIILDFQKYSGGFWNALAE